MCHGSLIFGEIGSRLTAMSNERFEDIAVLSTIAELRKKGLLGEQDLTDLSNQLQSEWGRRALEKMQQNNGKPDPDDMRLLQRYSNAFGV